MIQHQRRLSWAFMKNSSPHMREWRAHACDHWRSAQTLILEARTFFKTRKKGHVLIKMDLKKKRRRAGKERSKLLKRRENHPGLIIINEIYYLDTTRYILNTNHEVLMQYLDVIEKDFTLLAQDNILRFRETIREVTRLLHNYISSVLTSIDHTRNFVNKINQEELTEYYQNAVQELTKNPCSKFVKQLRIYIQHRKLPTTKGELTLTKIHGTSDKFD